MGKPRWTLTFMDQDRGNYYLVADYLYIENGVLIFSNASVHGGDQCVATYAPSVWAEVHRESEGEWKVVKRITSAPEFEFEVG